MGTGLDSSLGFVRETKYGEYKAPSEFMEVESIGLQRKSNYTSSRPLRKRPGIPASRHKETTRWAEGAIGLEVPNKGFGPILYQLHGENEATSGPKKQGETTAYRQKHPLGVTPPNGKSLTIQANKPTGASDEPFTYLGCKFTQATFSCDTSAQLKASLDTNAADLVTNKALGVASYPDPIGSYLWEDAFVKIGAEEPTASGLIIHSFNLVVPLPMKTGRWGMGRGGVQGEPIGFNETLKPTVALTCEFSNLELFNHYINQDEVPITIGFKGAVIAGEFHEEISFTIPVAKFVGEDPAVSGPDLVDQTASIEVYDSIENALITAEYQSIDSSL